MVLDWPGLTCISPQAAELAGQSAEEFYAAQVKDRTGLIISPTFTDLQQHQQPGTFSYEMKITVEREMMEKIRKVKQFHLAMSESSWSVLVRRIRRGELKTLQLAFTDTDWSLVVRTVRLGQERHVIRTSLASILSHLQHQEQDREVNTASINSAKQEVASLISQLTRPEDLT